ncbi:MAG: glycosyltransferase family 4 protein [Chloroflexi bacterium]|nr:glycosyltransferase family 4 protein [Chloroflexota bacterium]
MPSPRILFIDFAPSAGGSIQSLRHILTHLPRQRYQPLALLSPTVAQEFARYGLDLPIFSYDAHQGTPLPAGSSTAQIQASSLAARIRNHRRWGSVWRMGSIARRLGARTWPTARFIARLIASEDIDLVHLNDALPLAEPGILAAWRQHCPSVILVRSFTPIDRFHTWISRLPAAAIVTSRPLLENQRQQGARFKNITIIANAIDPGEYQGKADRPGVRREFGLSPDAILVIVVGRLMRRKGLDIFLQALAQVIPQHPQLHALIVGGEEINEIGLQSQLQQLAQDLSIIDHVHFTGPRGDVPRLLQAADIASFVPREPEPFGRVIIEAMAAGLPVIGARHGAIPDIIREGETGLIVPAADPSALAVALQQLLAQPALAHAMGQAGRARVASHYSIKQQIRQLTTLYDQILDTR